jgi:hypothetical protein
VSSPDPATALVVAAATAIAAGAALQVPYTLHPEPDDPSLLAGAVFITAWLAVLLSGAGPALAAMSDRLSVTLAGTRALALLPFAAAAFVVVSFLTFDSYYAPDAVRVSQDRGEMVPWVAGYAVLAIVAAWTAYRRARGALLLTSAVIWFVYPLGVAIHGGH